MPRPRKETPEIRKRFVAVRLEDAEYEKLRGACLELRITMSAYIRARLMGGRIRMPRYSRIDSLNINQLNRLGGLLKKIHTESGGAYKEESSETIREIRATIKLIQKGIIDDREAHTESERA
jgi:hypothetical protein